MKSRKRRTTRTRRPGNRAKRRTHRTPQTIEQFFALPERTQDIYTRVTHAVSKMKADDVSLPQAAQEYGVSRRQMQRFGGEALRKLKNGRYTAKVRDSLLRVLVILTLEGLREIAVIDSRQATLLAEYWNAVHRYLETGNGSALQEFAGTHVTDA